MSDNSAIRSAVDIAMAGERPMDSNNEQQPSGTPVRSAVEIAMAGGPRPMDSNTEQETQYAGIAPQTGSYESQSSSQTEVDLNKYNENITPSTNTVIENWNKNMSTNTPSLVVATEKQNSVTPEIETRDLHQEALDSNKNANEGFVSGPVLSNTGRSFFENEDVHGENAKLREDIEDLKKQIAELTKKFDDPNALQEALDPNKSRPLNPLEEVQTTLLKEEDERQRKFAQDVEDERIKYDPTYNPNLIPSVTPIPKTPELTTTTAIEAAEKENRERNLKRVALIAGVAVGGTGGVLGGTPVAGIGALACAGAGLLNKGLDFAGGRRIEKLTAQLKMATDSEIRAKLEKRISNWEKIRKGTVYAAQFFKGATMGFAASGLAMGIFNAGHGLVWNTPDVSAGTVTGTTTGGTESSQTSIPENIQSTSPIESVPETYDLFANGQVNLEGSAMDGWRLADIPEYYQNMPLEQIPAEQFANTGSKAFQIFIRDLQGNGVTNEMLNQIPKPVLHRALAQGAYNQTSILEYLRSLGYLVK